MSSFASPWASLVARTASQWFVFSTEVKNRQDVSVCPAMPYSEKGSLRPSVPSNIPYRF